MENGYAELVGAEHFIQGFHLYTCQGIPILGPGQQIVGVLSTSLQRPEASQRLREIMIVAAQGIGAELIVREWESMLQSMLQHAQLSPETLEKLRQDLIQLYSAGRMHVELAALHLSRMEHEQRPEAGHRLLNAAARAMERFREQSLLCLRLASQGADPCDWFHVCSVLNPIAELLATEAHICQVTVLRSGPQDAWIYADRRQLERNVLRLFLEGLHAAKGSILSMDVVPHADPLSLEIRFTSRSDSQAHASRSALFVSAQGAITIERQSNTMKEIRV
jgi:hypothetical protein